MKKISLWLVLLTILTGCSLALPDDPITRDKLSENMGEVLELEREVSSIQTYMTMYGSAMTEDMLKAVKSIYDRYYLYYMAANVALANGDIELYRKHLAMAKAEVEKIMHALSKEDQADYHGGTQRAGQSSEREI